MGKRSIGILLMVVVASGCGQAGAVTGGSATSAGKSSGTVLSSSVHQPTNAVPITGGTERQRVAVKRILAGLGSENIISRVAIATHGPHGFAGASGDWVAVTVSGIKRDAVAGQWQAELLAGSLSDISASSRLPRIGGLILSTGGARVVGIADHPKITAMEPDTPAITRNLAKIGLKPISITYLHPASGVAPIVVAKIVDPAAFAARSENSASAVFGNLNAYEGTYLQVENAAGALIEVSAYASRAASGTGWTRPGTPSVAVHG